VLLAAVLAPVAIAAGLILRQRQRSAAPTQGDYVVPAQLDRADFAGPSTPWLVAVFSSATCSSCAAVVEKARVLACDDVAVDEVEVSARAAAHKRYKIEAVPITVVADVDGVVRASFIGPVTATDLWASVAEARQPGSSPEPGLGRGEISS
jgi:hypothetical protein